MPTTPEDLTKVPTADLLRQLTDLLPEGSFEQLQIKGALVGLSTPEVTRGSNAPTGLDPLERARTVLKATLPEISKSLPHNPIVEELLKRYRS